LAIIVEALIVFFGKILIFLTAAREKEVNSTSNINCDVEFRVFLSILLDISECMLQEWRGLKRARNVNILEVHHSIGQLSLPGCGAHLPALCVMKASSAGHEYVVSLC
jgi:hypothetical protein